MKTALITGGARGIGRAIVENLAKDHRIATTYNSTAPDDLLKAHPKVFAIQADLSAQDVPPKVIEAVLKKFGQIDVIVNNAGAIEMTPLDGVDPAAEIANLTVNLLAPMGLLAAAIPHLKRGAAVVNISSVNAYLPAMGASGYSASKAAMNTWTRGAAKELGPKGIRVNGVAPGAIERVESPRPADLVAKFVEMTALGRSGVPEDIAKAVRFLASDEASFITGETLTVSGGYRL
ncbi:SDR family oxidoreductase [Planktotalea sp.]|uniref:SDR family NAD(P)-dependent oxidoreductase n=1 Tax=Planktotalea sp. TaxID=2029877 RepID=UPI003299DA38